MRNTGGYFSIIEEQSIEQGRGETRTNDARGDDCPLPKNRDARWNLAGRKENLTAFKRDAMEKPSTRR